MTHGTTYNKSPRRINHKATKSKTNTGTTALERSVEHKPGLTVELTDESATAGEQASAPVQSINKPPKRPPLQPAELSQNLINTMFEGTSDIEVVENENEFWDLPKLKGPEKGPAISQSLATLINTACTSQCATDNIVNKYRIPSNCDKLTSPMVNNEIWKIGKRKVQGVPQSQTAALPRPQEEEETDKSKQPQTEQTYEKH